MPSPPKSLRDKPWVVAVFVVVALALRFGLRSLFDALPATEEPWLRAALVHTAFAAVVLVYEFRLGRPRELFGFAPAWAFAPALVIVVGAATLSLASAALVPGATSVPADAPLAWVFWVPAVEELVYRGGLQRGLGIYLKPPLAVWFAAVVFASLHGTPLGPLLLGLLTGAVFAKTGRILPAIALHAACNATPLIFGAIDARWLDWLAALYQ